MTDLPLKRPTLLDLAILVASIAAALGLLRWRLEMADYWRFLGTIADAPPWRWPARLVTARLSGLFDLACPFALAGTVGVLALRLIPPRPSRDELGRQPGFVACCAFLAVAAFAAASVAATLGIRGRLGAMSRPELVGACVMAAGLAAQLGGLAIAVAWSAIALAGRTRKEASLPDRLGRWLGWFWIASGLIMTDVHNSVLFRI